MPIGKYKDFDACVRANSSKKDPKAYCGKIKHAVEAVMNPQVREILDVSEAQFSKDEDTGKMTARVAIIKAGQAKGKNRRYSSASVRKAAKEGVYDGIRMFVNHSDKPPTKRGYDELVSAVESTEYDAKTDAVVGTVEFFDEKFFEKAQRAKKHIGLSADHRIGVTYVQEGAERIEHVNSIIGARSVDWVVYPAAGGEILEFVKESEGADEVEWDKITLDQLKENAPSLLESYKNELTAQESEDDDKGEGKGKEKTTEKTVTESAMSKEDIAKLVQEGVAEALKTRDADDTKRSDAQKKVREYVGKSGLPPRTRDRVINSFSGVSEYVEDDVKEAVEDAKEEIRELKGGPRIKGMGATSTGAQASDAPAQISVRESVESFFIPKTDKKDDAASSGKES